MKANKVISEMISNKARLKTNKVYLCGTDDRGYGEILGVHGDERDEAIYLIFDPGPCCSHCNRGVD